MDRTKLLGEIRETLNNAGFYVSELYSLRPIGFDIVARRDNSLLIIKVLTNIDAMTNDVAGEIKTLANLLQGCPLIVGERYSTAKLEDDVVYERCEIPSINIVTFKNHLLEGIPLEIYAAPGGLYVSLNNKKIKELREEQKLSIGSFARSLKVSRRTVQMYENGMNASVEVALRIENVLGEEITDPINILNYKLTQKEIKADKINTPNIRDFQKEIFEILKQIGYRVIPMKRCPFEAVSKDKKKILLTCVDRYDKKLIKKAKVVTSISNITEKQAVIIPDKNINKKNIEGTPLIIKKELKKAREPEEIIELILERLYNKQ